MLETPRLLLREIVADDEAAIFAIRGDYAVTHWNIGASYKTDVQARHLIREMARLYRAKSELRWGIVVKDEIVIDETLDPAEATTAGVVVGMIGFNKWNHDDWRGEIGFDLKQSRWRRGIMREALGAVLEFGFTRMNLNRIEATASVGNIASIALLEQSGFVREGTQRDQYFDLEDGRFYNLHLFGLLRREYLNPPNDAV